MPDDKSPQPTQTDSTDTAPSPESRRDELPGVRWKKGRNARYTFEQWSSVYAAWKEGERGLKALERRFHIDADTRSVWVRKGVASLHRPAFLDRLRDENDIVREAKSKAAERMTEEILDERGKVRRGNLEVLMGLRRVVGATLAKAIEKFDTITWIKTDAVQGKLVARPLNAHEYASIVRQLSGAMALVGKMESFFVGDVKDPDDIPDELKFTPEELKFIQQPGNEDKLPPGMTLDQLARKTAAWCGVSPMKA